jgi:hypothetical protein
MFDEKVDHVVALVRMLFHFVDGLVVVHKKNEEEELADDEVKQQVVTQV